MNQEMLILMVGARASIPAEQPGLRLVEKLREIVKSWDLHLVTLPTFERACVFVSQRDSIEVVHFVDDVELGFHGYAVGCPPFAEILARRTNKPDLNFVGRGFQCFSRIFEQRGLRVSFGSIEDAVRRRYRERELTVAAI